MTDDPGVPAGPAIQAHAHTNRLAGETSPYLLQHAHNPVDWHPWGPEALARARLLDLPIFLSIGYAACHWCHVMERESFENAGTASYLNEHFIAIKVDREERPDLDGIYMSAVQAMSGGGGWPMSVFVTADGRPFYGGTYFPPEPRHGLPSFRQVLEGVARAWAEDREGVEGTGTRLAATLAEQARVPATDDQPTPELLDMAVELIERGYDGTYRGWGREPKFPQPMTIEFLLRRAEATGDPRTLSMARGALDAMAAGGIHDQLGGGFHRYATDAAWLVPHFEQMLYDNAQLARVYLDAWTVTGDAAYETVGRGVLDFMIRDLTTVDGAFAASLDADTEGEEGATFTWHAEEIREALGPETALFATAYGVRDDGNWEGVTILSRVLRDGAVAELYGIPVADARARLAGARTLLFDRRSRRAQPARDGKALAAWNGLAIGALADASRRLALADDGALPPGSAPAADRQSAAARYLAAAVRAAETITSGLLAEDGRLGRSWKYGRATGDGVLEDYADLAEGLLALYEATFDERWFQIARGLAEAMLVRFADPEGGFFDTPSDGERLVARPKDVQDNATPSGNAMATIVLLRLAALTGEHRYRAAAERALRTITPFTARYATAFAKWLTAIDLAVAPIAEIAIVGSLGDPATTALLRVASGGGTNRVVALAADPAASIVPLLDDRRALDGRPTAYVCRDFTCRLPVTDPDALAEQLREIRVAL